MTFLSFRKALRPTLSLPRCWVCALAIVILAILSIGCSRRPALVVGSKNSTEQSLVGEIIAQHLEHRLNQTVERRPNLNGTSAAYQLLQSGEVSLYPEYTGTILSDVLGEPPASDPAQVLDRARSELLRTGHVEVLNPLGFDNPIVMVIRTDDPRASQTGTLDQAAAAAQGGDAKHGWKIAVSYAFQQGNAITLLTKYALPMAAAVRGMEAANLFPALQHGDVSMIAARATDSLLASIDQANSPFKIVTDNRQLFPPEQAVILARQDVLANTPGLRAALDQLSGKFTTARVRQLTSAVDIGHRGVPAVAAEFLTSAGLK